MRDEPAVDTGGVLRQAFTEFFSMVSNGTANFWLFTGPDGRLSPAYSSEHILTVVFEISEKVVALLHNLSSKGSQVSHNLHQVYFVMLPQGI